MIERDKLRLKTDSTSSKESYIRDLESPGFSRHRRKSSNNLRHTFSNSTPLSRHNSNKANSANFDLEDCPSERKQSIHDILEIDELPSQFNEDSSPPLRPDRKRKRRSTREHNLGSIFKGLHLGISESTEKVTFTNKSATKDDLAYIVCCLQLHSIFFFSKFPRCTPP